MDDTYLTNNGTKHRLLDQKEIILAGQKVNVFMVRTPGDVQTSHYRAYARLKDKNYSKDDLLMKINELHNTIEKLEKDMKDQQEAKK